MKCFDPSKLQSNRRASLTETCRNHSTNLKEFDNKGLFQFRARPLPGGKPVKNDVFAPTKAVLGKKTVKLEKQLGSSPKYHHKNKESSKEEDLNESEEYKWAQLVLQDICKRLHEETSKFENEGPSLQRDLAHLQLVLNRKKTIRAKKAKLLKEKELEGARLAATYAYFNLNKLFDVTGDEQIDVNATHVDKDGSCLFGSKQMDQVHFLSLFERQEKWLSACRKRCEAARIEKEEEIMVSLYFP